MAPRADAALGKERRERFGVSCPHRIQVPHRPAAGRHREAAQVPGALERVGVRGGQLTSLPVPLVEQRQLPEQDRRL